jgi:uncharacterized protein YbaP (TraB family)
MKTTFTLLGIFVFLLQIQAQNLENSTLWKIEGNNLSSPSYLFGTIHMTCDASLEDKVLKALEATDQLILELDMDDPQLQAAMMQHMMMKDNTKISDMLSEEDYQVLDAFLTRELGMGLAMMNGMKPFMIQASFYPKLLECPMQSFEMELVKASQSQEEPIYGLETVADQMTVFDSIPYTEQLKDLLKMAKNNMADDKKLFKEMLDTYQSQDIDALLELTSEDDNALSQYQDLLLERRNKNWIEKIESYAKDKPSFFGVGAAHLPGDTGVIQLLKNKGYQLTPVFLTPKVICFRS